MTSTLYYVHDPMCSWCWGFSNTFAELLSQLPKNIEVKRLLGGLAADSAVPMSESMQQQIKNNWFRIEDTIPDVKFNFDFWEKTIPRRSTYPACRAVIAARLQGEAHDLSMTKAIQTAYYLQARNPSENTTLIKLATEIGLNKAIFKRDFYSEKVQQELNKEMIQSRERFVESYPSLVIEKGKNAQNININYTQYNEMLNHITAFLENT